MSKLEHTRSLISKLTNIYKSGGVKQALSDSSCDSINPSIHTCGRLFAHAVQKVAFVVSICFMLFACQKAELISSDEVSGTRGQEPTTEEPTDSATVTPDFTVNGEWVGIIDVNFGFGGDAGSNGEEE